MSRLIVHIGISLLSMLVIACSLSLRSLPATIFISALSFYLGSFFLIKNQVKSFLLTVLILISSTWLYCLTLYLINPALINILIPHILICSSIGTVLGSISGRQQKLKFFFLTGILLCAALAAYSTYIVPEIFFTARVSSVTRKINYSSLHQLRGPTLDARTFHQHAVVLDFWSIRCAPCLKQLPYMEQLKNIYENEKDVLFISVNSTDSLSKAEAFLRNHPYNLNFFYDRNKSLYNQMQVGALPATFIIGKNAAVKYEHLGFSIHEKPVFVSKMKKLIDSTLRGDSLNL